MADIRVLRLLEIFQYGAGGNHSVCQMVHSEAFQIARTEVFQQLLTCATVGEDPVFHLERGVFSAEIPREVPAATFIIEHLLRRKVAQQLLNVVIRAFAREELARGYVEKRHAARPFSEVNGSEEVVLLIVQHVVAHRHSRRHQLRNAALHELFRQLRVF